MSDSFEDEMIKRCDPAGYWKQRAEKAEELLRKVYEHEKEFYVGLPLEWLKEIKSVLSLTKEED